jgi:hypothetical protein
LLKDKHIAVVSVKSFNFEGLIVSGLQDLGAKVQWFDERPSNSTFSKVVLRVQPKLLSRAVKKHYQSILDSTESRQPDIWLFIKGELIPQWFLKVLKQRNRNVKLILYSADSAANNRALPAKKDWFDKTATFDHLDAKNYHLTHQTLFFDPFFSTHSKPWQSRKYDICFLGTLHSDRQNVVAKIEEQTKGKLFNIFYYSHGWLVSLYLQRFGLRFNKSQLKYISRKAKSREEIRQNFLDSKVLIDVHHPGQNGLTLRTIEGLAAGCKLITTNSDIKQYPFYNKRNILIIDRKNPKIPEWFLDQEPVDLTKRLLPLRLDNWLKELLNEA